MKSLIGKQIIVRLKWNKTEYKGILLSIDNYMNLQLNETYEINPKEDGEVKEELIGEIFIRCNNVLFIREASEKQSDENQTQQLEKKNDEYVIEETKEEEEVTEVVMEETES